MPEEKILEAIRKALANGGNKHYTVSGFKGLNHLFQPAETGLPQEYARLKETFSADALKIIAGWIKEIK